MTVFYLRNGNNLEVYRICLLSVPFFSGRKRLLVGSRENQTISRAGRCTHVYSCLFYARGAVKCSVQRHNLKPSDTETMSSLNCSGNVLRCGHEQTCLRLDVMLLTWGHHRWPSDGLFYYALPHFLEQVQTYHM